jgi:hypothetical protein
VLLISCLLALLGFGKGDVCHELVKFRLGVDAARCSAAAFIAVFDSMLRSVEHAQSGELLLLLRLKLLLGLFWRGNFALGLSYRSLTSIAERHGEQQIQGDDNRTDRISCVPLVIISPRASVQNSAVSPIASVHSSASASENSRNRRICSRVRES